MRVGRQVAMSLLYHKITNGKQWNKREALEEAIRCLGVVKIPEYETRYKNFPHQFSGGQRQRIAIAMALITSPQILIADEPTTALDVTVQGQILELIKEQQKKQNLSVIFITHDLAVVSNIATKIIVMRNGEIVERGTRDEIFSNPQHPYTKALIAIASRSEKGDLHRLPTVKDFLDE
jgi:oligopeptide transport system ATP-binding protein